MDWKFDPKPSVMLEAQPMLMLTWLLMASLAGHLCAQDLGIRARPVDKDSLQQSSTHAVTSHSRLSVSGQDELSAYRRTFNCL